MTISRLTIFAAVLIFLFLLPISTSAGRRLNRLPRDDHKKQHSTTIQVTKPRNLYKVRETMVKRMGADPLQIAGSSLPDCSHACGSCSPCRLVMVSFVCASLEEAETCPMAYKCMCKSKSYPVP